MRTIANTQRPDADVDVDVAVDVDMYMWSWPNIDIDVDGTTMSRVGHYALCLASASLLLFTK